MCGVFGIIGFRGLPDAAPAACGAMRDALRHRGPDGDGIATAGDGMVGATRLRVVDLDPRADQPFTDPSGCVVLACNGEIYNAAELRRRFPAYPYASRSDSETLLPLYLERGARGLADAVGMFAIAIWDTRCRRLTLARDRAGEKPLFWAEHGGAVWFASEIGALLRAGVPGFPLDHTALAEYLAFGYALEPRTLHTGVHKVPAGTILTLDAAATTATAYWTDSPPAAPAVSAVSAIRHTLADAVRSQLASDTPLGVFTSGGLDSSLLASLAVRALGAANVPTFAVGFDDPAFDERPVARRFARHLGTPHAEVVVPDDAVPAALDALAATGEPLADPAGVPTLLLARAARRQVTVVLSGEGGDELFGGYPTYLGHRWAPTFTALPRPLRAALVAGARLLPPSRGRVPLEFLLKRFVAAAHLPWPARHAAWFGGGLPSSPSVGGGLAGWGIGGDEDGGADIVTAAMDLDYRTALRERLLVKVDRATMLASLEARSPFLDPAVTRAARAAAGRAHVGRFTTKRLLREVARDLVPEFILRRRKRGLTVPLARWLDGALAAQVAACRDLPRLTGGLVSAAALDRLLATPASRIRDARGLWTLVALRHWMRAWNLEGG
jgi:asparagine synthase (glutamine-hydrolysing)